MNRRHTDALPSRRFLRWLEANQEGIAWACLGALSAVSTVIAWEVLIA